MFNTGRFNLLPFNVRAQSLPDIAYAARMEARFHNATAHGENVFLEASVLAAFLAEGTVSAGVFALAEWVGAFGADAKVKSDHYEAPQMTEGFAGVFWLGENMDVSSRMLETMARDLWMSHNTGFGMAAAGVVNAYAYVSKKVYATDIRMSAAINAQVTTLFFDVLYAVIDVVIPPGGVLVIDSGDYTAHLNEQDVIDRYSGDWLTLSRNVHDVVIESGGKALTGGKMILYVERWL